MKGMDEQGFTLIEVIVVIAVISVLAAILTPSIIKHIDDSRLAKAKGECQTMAAAITSFYKDLGEWPRGRNDNITVLETRNGNMPGGNGSAAAWVSGGTRVALRDILIRNRDDVGANAYPTAGENAWRGPYSVDFGNDPWGNKYLVNVANGSVANRAVWVLSAGPNGLVTTPFNQGTNGVNPPVATGDDIGFRIK